MKIKITENLRMVLDAALHLDENRQPITGPNIAQAINTGTNRAGSFVQRLALEPFCILKKAERLPVGHQGKMVQTYTIDRRRALDMMTAAPDNLDRVNSAIEGDLLRKMELIERDVRAILHREAPGAPSCEDLRRDLHRVRAMLLDDYGLEVTASPVRHLDAMIMRT